MPRTSTKLQLVHHLCWFHKNFPHCLLWEPMEAHCKIWLHWNVHHNCLTTPWRYIGQSNEWWRVFRPIPSHHCCETKPCSNPHIVLCDILCNAVWLLSCYRRSTTDARLITHQTAPNHPCTEPNIHVTGQRLSAMDKFTYLASTLSGSVNIDAEG